MTIHAPKIVFSISDEAETFALAKQITPLLKAGDVLALNGDLGAGKTTFSRALIQTLLGNPELDVTSPTFTLVLTYDGPNFPIWHYDMYRIEDESELDELGFEDTIDGLAIIEWPIRMGDQLPRYRLDIQIDFSDTGRIISLTGHGEEWITRLAKLS